jgi:hypothetical protein
MDPHSPVKPRLVLVVEPLEQRCVLTTVTITLNPVLDQFGNLIQTIQAYGSPDRFAFAFLDTGAAPVAFSVGDRGQMTGGAIPVKATDTAQASGVGGQITGDVSQPATILADGLHASSLSFNQYSMASWSATFTSGSARTAGIQAFLGTSDGSPALPTVTGTPIFEASSLAPSGYAALIDLQGYKQDLSSVAAGLTLNEPDVRFVAPSTTLTGTQETTLPLQIPLTFYGSDNYTDPGDESTISYNPENKNVTLVSGGATLSAQQFVFDTGSQVTLISTAEARALNLDLANPQTTIVVQGVGGPEVVPGYTLDSLSVPLVGGNTLKFTNVPVFVLDTAPDLDGLLGMNLFNLGAQMLYNPHEGGGASLTITFYNDPQKDRGNSGSVLAGFLGQPAKAPLAPIMVSPPALPTLPAVTNTSGSDGTANDIRLPTPAPDPSSTLNLNPLVQQLNSQLALQDSIPAMINALIARVTGSATPVAPGDSASTSPTSDPAPAVESGDTLGQTSRQAAAAPAVARALRTDSDPSSQNDPGVSTAVAAVRSQARTITVVVPSGAANPAIVVLVPVPAGARSVGLRLDGGSPAGPILEEGDLPQERSGAVALPGGSSSGREIREGREDLALALERRATDVCFAEEGETIAPRRDAPVLAEKVGELSAAAAAALVAVLAGYWSPPDPTEPAPVRRRPRLGP